MFQAAANDTFVTLVAKLTANTTGGAIPNESLLTTLLGALLLPAQGGIWQQQPGTPTDEYLLWRYVLQNQCGPLVWDNNDTQPTILGKILNNMGGANTRAPNDTLYVLVQKMVNNGLALTNCFFLKP